MPLKGLPHSLDYATREEDLRHLAATGRVEDYRQLTQTVRDHLFAFLKKSGIPEFRIIVLGMMLESKHPDILTLKKLGEIIDGIRHRIIEQTMLEDQKRKFSAPKEDKKPELILRPNPNRILSPREMVERFKKLRIDLLQLIKSWQIFYYNQPRFAKAVTKATFSKAYSLVMPAVSEQAMQAFEKAYRSGKINTFMIDDARVPDGTNLRAFKRKTLRRFKQKYKYRSVYEAETYLNKSTLTPPIVRIIGFNREESVCDPKNIAAKYGPNEPHFTTMGLGTFIRLFEYLDMHDPDGLEMLTHYVTKGSRVLDQLTVVLNNKTDKEGFLTIGPDKKDPRMRLSVEKTPAVISVPDLFETPIPVVSSEDFGNVVKMNDSRHIAHMSTWPAPPGDESDGVEGEDNDIPF